MIVTLEEKYVSTSHARDASREGVKRRSVVHGGQPAAHHGTSKTFRPLNHFAIASFMRTERMCRIHNWRERG